MILDELDDELFDDDEIKAEFKTRTEKIRQQKAKQQEKFRQAHGVKKFVADFKKDEGLEKIQERLKRDGVTNKEFVVRSFERYEKDGGFPEND